MTENNRNDSFECDGRKYDLFNYKLPAGSVAMCVKMYKMKSEWVTIKKKIDFNEICYIPTGPKYTEKNVE